MKLWLALAVLGLGLRAEDLSRTVSRQTWDTESGLPQNTVQAILQTHEGYLWFATEGGLARFDSERFAVFTTRNTPQLRSNDIRGLLEEASGTLWIATGDGVTSLDSKGFHSFTTENGLPSNNASALFQADRSVCVLTSNGAACLKYGQFTAVSTPKTPHTQPDKNLQQFVTSAILCSYKDREGNTWIGTESTGVTILRKLPFESFSDRSEGLDDQVRCVYRDHAGGIWFGTDSQGLIRYQNGRFARYTVADGLSSNVIVSMGEDQTGDLLIGTPDGLNRLHDRTITLETSSEGLPDDFIRSIHTDPDGTVWLGTRRGLVRSRDHHFQTFTHADGLGSDLIGSITRDSAGMLWIGTLNGLSRLDGSAQGSDTSREGSKEHAKPSVGELQTEPVLRGFLKAHFTNFTTANGLSNDIITALYNDRQGSLWIGTQGGGLDRSTNGVIKHVTLAGLPEMIYGITKDNRGNLWLASDTGIARVTDGSEVVSYGVSDGLRVNECSGGGHPGIAVAPDGGIWFSTLRGAALLRPDFSFNHIPPPVVVESINVDNRIVPWSPSLEIKPGYSRLAFNYAALSFTAPQKVLYRYRLEGFDKNWVDAGNARTAFYTNLGPGAYTFRVIARNGDGIWNDAGANLALNLRPHFYQTWWFATLMLFPLGAAGYGIYRWRLASVEAQMEARFQAVLQERNRIAREIHDTLAQGFAGISVQLELVSRKLVPAADAARQHLDQARMLVRSSLSEARRSIWELRSQSADIEDLAARLSKMATQMSGPGQPKVAVQVRGTYRPLPPRTEDELLRIAQEAVTNAIRHAEASQIDVEIAFDPRLLRMTVADNGRGFQPTGQTTGVNGHFGLKGMLERAEGIDAKLKLDTAPGAGTRVSVEVAV
jgi:signal transduction histidine kinase/ligand-binding sensor domain-containing protein